MCSRLLSKPQQSKNRIRNIIVFISAVSALILLGVTYTINTWNVSVEAKEREAIQLAEAAETGISKSLIVKLKHDSTDIDREEYKEIKHALTSVSHLDNDIRFSYILVNRGGKIHISADSEQVDSKDYSPPGQEYTEAAKEYYIPFSSGQTLLTKPTSDRWGKWISVLVPMKDLQTGEIIAVFGVDYPAESWNRNAMGRTIQAGFVAVSVWILFAVFYFALAQNRQLRREKEKLIDSEKNLQESETLFRTVFDQATIGISIGNNQRYISSIQNNRPSINPMYEKITGRTKDELASISWADITHPEDLTADLEQFEKFRAGEISGYELEKRYIRPDGSTVWIHMSISPLYFDMPEDYNYLCLIIDITEQKEQEMRLKYISEHDTLTGLYNRRYFEAMLTRELSSNIESKRAVLLINLGKYSLVKITHGYLYSENLIKDLAGKLSLLGTANRRLLHISMDQFAFYVGEYKNKIEIEELCDSIIEILDTSLSLNYIQGSIGIVEIEGYKCDADNILKFASIAAEHASEAQTTGYCYFDREMEEKILRKEAIKNELAKAIKDEQEGLYLEYQPIVAHWGDSIYGFEALARYRSAKLGLVSPVEFIPIAEETQLIIPLGRKIMSLAFGFLKRLEAEGHENTKVSINVSAIQLLRDDFFSDLMEIINETKIKTANLCIEITESVFSNNYQDINAKLGQIKQLGIEVSIDDFGTGYSSLARERELNVSCLKIDKYFIDKLLILDSQEAITGDIISMAHKLGHRVVAEGVELEVQKQYLIEHNCDLMQGYLFSKPLPQEAAIELLKIVRY
ncbi:MAG TPA: EAL domain-containing protein [Patescibacteria group bacterium]|nr:EAL domain-containing protein [Patescibacteria group bacterium]